MLRQHRLRDEPPLPRVTELSNPVVVGMYTRELDLTVGAVDLCSTEGDAGVEDLEQDREASLRRGLAGCGLQFSAALRGLSSRDSDHAFAQGGG